MKIDVSKYSIPELQEALATINERDHPENKAALDRELQLRRDSGEFDRYVEEARSAQEKQQASKLSFALKMRQAIAGYLVIASLYAFAGLSFQASNTSVAYVLMILLGLFLVASFAGGAGLLLNKTWGHPIAVAVLGIQLLSVQFDGFAFSALSLVGIYVFASAGGEIGLTATFDPGLTVAIGQSAPLWIGVNIFCAILIGYLITAKRAA